MNDYVSKLFEDYRRVNNLPPDTELELYYDQDAGDIKAALKGTVTGSCIEIPDSGPCW